MDVKDMIGYKSPAAKMKTNTIDKLIGVKSPKFDNLPPIVQRNTTVQDFNLKRDIHLNNSPIDVQDKPRNSDDSIASETTRLEKAFSFLDNEYSSPADHFFPGHSKAGGRLNRVLAWAGSKSAKRRVARAKRNVIIDKVVHTGAKVAKEMNPDVDPDVVEGGAALTAWGAKGANKSASKFFEKRSDERKKKLKALGK